MKLSNIIFAVVAGTFLASCSSSPETNTEVSGEIVEEVTEAIEDMEPAVEVIRLNQIPGEFTNGNLTLEAGTYTFEVSNSGTTGRWSLFQ